MTNPVRSIYTKFVRFYWGSNHAKKNARNNAMRRSVKKQARNIDTKIAEE